MSNADDPSTDQPESPAPAATPAPPPTPPRRTPQGGRARFLTALAVSFFLAASGIVGYAIGADHGSSTSNPSGIAAFPGSQGSTRQAPTGQQQTSSADVSAIADQVDPSVVNITTTMSSGGEAAGTGIVISSSGLVLTNNHVIADSTSIDVAIDGSDTTHSAKVLGYDVADDVALLQIQGVSSLKAAPLGNSSTLSVGDAVVAIGNAGGRGGTPTAVGGSVTALDQQITASDQDGSHAETLSGLIQVDANIQPGDSGGPLVDADGKVVGMNVAAARGNGGFGFRGPSSNEGYAIPIEDALAIAKKISSGAGGTDIHIGSARAVLGVEVRDESATANDGDPFGRNGGLGGGTGTSTEGADVIGVQSGSGAESAGITAGDVIVAIDGTSVGSATELTHVMVAYSPKDNVDVTWIDSSGTTRHASVTLGSGPPA